MFGPFLVQGYVHFLEDRSFAVILFLSLSSPFFKANEQLLSSACSLEYFLANFPLGKSMRIGGTDFQPYEKLLLLDTARPSKKRTQNSDLEYQIPLGL